jgi:hypothetical protein
MAIQYYTDMIRVFSLVMFSIVAISTIGCDSPNEPTVGGALFTGHVVVLDSCNKQGAGGGVKVEIPELGLTMLTDSSGRYSFTTSNIQRYYSLRISKLGHYTSRNFIYASYNEDSAHYVMSRAELYKVFDFSGELVDTIGYVREFQPTYRDTTYVDQNGVLVTKSVVADSINASRYTFKLVGIDAQGRRTNWVEPRLLWSTSPNIDLSDSTSYQSVSEYNGWDATYHRVTMYESEFFAHGLRSGDKIYIAASGVGKCWTGLKHGAKRSDVRELVLR